MDNRQLFLRHIAQTSPAPLGLEITSSNNVYLNASDGKKYWDLISGFNVNNIGHSHPKVIKAVIDQASAYMHLIVYGEFIQQPQIAYAKLLFSFLPNSLDCVYFTNSGTEATEGAMKLAKRITGRPNIIAFNNAYHGSTQGALSVMGDEYFRNSFRPLLPCVFHYPYLSNEVFQAIDNETACVLVEMVQAESGVVKAQQGWMQTLRDKCTEMGALLIVDEIQSGFGRTGKLWAYEHFNVIPDVLLLGKALGGGMPLGAFISSHENMNLLTHSPVLGHITTFGGHPVSCAAGKAALEVLMNEKMMEGVQAKEQLLNTFMSHPAIVKKRSAGLWMAIEFETAEINKAIIAKCLQAGIVTDWFLFNDRALRIAPPLSITLEELSTVCKTLLNCIKDAVNKLE